MPMNAETIKARMDKLYELDWANFNLFVPELLMVSGMGNKDSKGVWKDSKVGGGG